LTLQIDHLQGLKVPFQHMVTGAKGYIGRNFINKYGNEYHLNPVSLSTSKNLDYKK
jgi:dTDP-D-glucose 4,6-dehydratase